MVSGGRLSSSNVAHLLAVNSAQSGRNVVLCDTTTQSEGKSDETPTQDFSFLPTKSLGDSISIAKGYGGTSFFISKNFNGAIKELTARFEQVFICSDSRNWHTGLMALSEFEPGLVVVSSLRRTKKIDIKNINLRQPIDVLFYD